MHSSSRRAVLAVLSSLVIAAGVFAQQRPQVPGAIRSRVVLVPVDVRVIDKDGNPITDLTQADFTVLEDGRLQQIGARNQRQVGEVRRRVELKLEPESYARMQTEGVKFETMIGLTGQPRYLKAVVYDYAADKLGSAVAEIK